MLDHMDSPVGIQLGVQVVLPTSGHISHINGCISSKKSSNICDQFWENVKEADVQLAISVGAFCE
jgi:hypothetical protein